MKETVLRPACLAAPSSIRLSRLMILISRHCACNSGAHNGFGICGSDQDRPHALAGDGLDLRRLLLGIGLLVDGQDHQLGATLLGRLLGPIGHPVEKRILARLHQKSDARGSGMDGVRGPSLVPASTSSQEQGG